MAGGVDAAVAPLEALWSSSEAGKRACGTLRKLWGVAPELTAALCSELGDVVQGAAPASAAPAPQVVVDTTAALASVGPVQGCTPRGRWRAHFLPREVALVSEGKAAPLVVPYASVRRALVLEAPKDALQGAVFLMLALKEPAQHGKASVPTVLLSFKPTDTLACANPRAGNDGEPETIDGPAPVVLCRLLGALGGIKPEAPDPSKGFLSSKGATSVAATLKVNGGLLFPMRNGIAFVDKPPLFLACEEWDGVELGRANGSSSTFDLSVSIASGAKHSFDMIERAELPGISAYVASRKKKFHAAPKGEAPEGGEAEGEGRDADADAESDSSDDSDFDGEESEEGEEGEEEEDDDDDDDAVDDSASEDNAEDDDDADDGAVKQEDEVMVVEKQEDDGGIPSIGGVVVLDDDDDDDDDGAGFAVVAADEPPAKRARAD